MRTGPGFLHALLPVLPVAKRGEVLRAGIGSMIGMCLCICLVLLWPRSADLPVALLAPIGATAVLIFAVPNTPLAQPWSAVMGNVVSALTAVAMLKLAPTAVLPALTVGAAIMAMLLLRALHPPGGAVALLAALDPAPVLQAGFAFALVPVGAMTLLLVICGTAYNRLTGRVYPFRQSAGEAKARIGLSDAELAGLLRRFNQTQNIGIADLGRLIAAAEQEAANHRFDGITCAQIMSSGLITVGPDTPLVRVGRQFRRHAIKSLPVVDAGGRCLGLILQRDLTEALLTPLRSREAGRLQPASSIMRPILGAVPDDLPVGQLLHRLAMQGDEVVPVTSDGRLTGIITRSDIMKLLLSDWESRPDSAIRTPEPPRRAATR